jgi:protein TonB
VQPNGVIEPALEVSGDALSGGESTLGGNFSESSKQPTAPAAPVQVGGDVKPARILSSVPPVYPALAKAQHVSGEVRIDALIDAAGRVTAMKVVSGPPLLHQAAIDSLRQWRYQAATLDGKPVAMHLTVTVQFRLQ